MPFPLFSQISSMSFFSGVEIADMCLLLVQRNCCSPKASTLTPAYAKQATLVVPSSFDLIAIVLRPAAAAQIHKPIVGRDVVTMINVVLGPNPVDVEPREAMGEVLTAVHRNKHVTDSVLPSCD